MAKIGNMGNSASETAMDTQPAPRGSSGLSTIVLAVLAGAFAGTVIGTSMSVFSKFQASGYDLKTVFLSGSATAISDQPAQIKPELMNAYLWSVRIRLDDLGLGKMLQVESFDNRQIRITGQVPAELGGRYELFKGWVGSQDNFPPLKDEVGLFETSGEFPRIEAVWLGDVPMLQLEGGREAGIGEKLDDVWLITQITALAVTLERDDGMVIELSYEPS